MQLCIDQVSKQLLHLSYANLKDNGYTFGTENRFCFYIIYFIVSYTTGLIKFFIFFNLPQIDVQYVELELFIEFLYI